MDLAKTLSRTKYTKIVSLLFNARTNAHIAHLQTKSYSAHKALDTFYNEVIDIADSFAEAAQVDGILTGYTLGELNTGDIIPFLEKQYKELMSSKKNFTEGHLLQLIDDATELFSQTIYKLKTLK